MVTKTFSGALCSLMSLKASTSLEKWYLDVDCPNHIIGNISYFQMLTEFVRGNITFENNRNGIWGKVGSETPS